MKLNKKFSIFLVIVLLSCCFATQPTFRQYSFQEQWHGNCLWIGSQENPQVPTGWIDPAKWIALFPGSWGNPMVSFSVSSATNAGMKSVCWDVYNDKGLILYPSDLFSGKVYQNPNSGHNFFTTDMVAIASQIAGLDKIDLKFTVHWNEGSVEPAIVKELLTKYPHINIIVVAHQLSTELIQQKLNEVLSEKQAHRVDVVEPEIIAQMIDLTTCDKNPLKSHDFHKDMIRKYLHFGKVAFKRDIIIYEKGQRCTIAVTGRNKWHVFVNGKFISSGVWKNGTWQDMAFLSGTYDVSELMEQGENTIVVVVESGFNERAFMANIRVDDMIYRCDDNWKAMAVDEIPSEENIGVLCQKQDWQAPIILARANIWPNTMGKVYWRRLYPWQDDDINSEDKSGNEE